MAGDPFFSVELLFGPDALDILVSIRYAQCDCGANLISHPVYGSPPALSTDGIPVTEAIDKTVWRYLKLCRIGPLEPGLAAPDESGAIAFLMVDLARPRRIFRKKALDVAAAVGDRELRRWGWRTELGETEWRQIVRGLYVGAGASEVFADAINHHWTPGSIPDTTVYDPIHEWASKYPWYLELKKKLKLS